jgi:membrane-associated phospholipid phosphatase
VTSRRRRIALGVYAGLFVVDVLLVGIPTDYTQIFLWLWFGALCYNIGQPWRVHLGFLRDWGPILVALLAYNYSRGAASHLGFPLHVTEPVRFDSWIAGGGELPTQWMQRNFYDPWHVHWYDVLASCVYFSHFLASLTVAWVLWIRNRERWRLFIRRFLTLTFAGLVTYVVYPMAPPWWAWEHGYVGTVVYRMSSRGFDVIGLNRAGHILERGQAVANPVAAMPSLHTAMSTLIATFFIWQLKSRWRWLLVLYPIAMGTTLVYTGEHYLLDILAGFVYAAAVMTGVWYVERWMDARKRARAAAPADSSVPVGEETLDKEIVVE